VRAVFPRFCSTPMPVCAHVFCWHRLLVVVVFFAGGGHVGIHAEQGGPREAQVVHVGELAVEPQVNVDHGNPLELVELAEERIGLPCFGHVALHDVHGHGGNVHVGFDLI